MNDKGNLLVRFVKTINHICNNEYLTATNNTHSWPQRQKIKGPGPGNDLQLQGVIFTHSLLPKCSHPYPGAPNVDYKYVSWGPGTQIVSPWEHWACLVDQKGRKSKGQTQETIHNHKRQHWHTPNHQNVNIAFVLVANVKQKYVLRKT